MIAGAIARIAAGALVTLLLAGCEVAGPGTPRTAVEPIPTLPPAITITNPTPDSAVPETGPLTPTDPPTAAPSPLPTTTAAAPEPIPTPHLMFPATIDGLSARHYPGGQIVIRQTLDTTDTYTRYAIAYPSDGLTITGVMQIPHGAGPFPVIILNHGYDDRAVYQSGSGTQAMAGYLNQRGYLTIAPDYRSWGQSDWAPSLFHSGLVADVVNLVSSLTSLPQADATWVGMWGHSMGGGITTKILTIDPRIRAAVLHAPNSANDADLIARWGRGCLPDEFEPTTMCNPAEVIPADLPDDIIQAYVSAAADPAILQQVSPINYLDRVSAPVQIHIGTADGATLAATPPEWSFALAQALQAGGKSVALHSYEGQGHFLTGQAWDEMATRTADFFDAHLNS